jgi:hypothetical protein
MSPDGVTLSPRVDPPIPPVPPFWVAQVTSADRYITG